VSVFTVTAIERLGTPLSSWLSLYQSSSLDPTPRTVDLTPYLQTLPSLQTTMERTLMSASMGQINLDLDDPTGAIATLLGPFSATLATTTRYFGPWVKIQEVVSGVAVDRFLGFVDESSLEWSEEEQSTKCTVFHASALLGVRQLNSIPGILRPLPKVPSASNVVFGADTAEHRLSLIAPGYVRPSNDAALETARWVSGILSWTAQMSSERGYDYLDSGRAILNNIQYPPPVPPSNRIQIGSTVYVLDPVQPVVALASFGVSSGSSSTGWTVYGLKIYPVVDLSAVLALGSNPPTTGTPVTFYASESQKTHYQLVTAISAPGAGTDGQRFMKLDGVDGLAAGDLLTVTQPDTNNAGRRTTNTYTVADIDGETATAYTVEPINVAIPASTSGQTIRIRRNSTDPILADLATMAKLAVAPFPIDVSNLKPPTTQRPVFSWSPVDLSLANGPRLFGAFDLHALAPASAGSNGTFRLCRRGGQNAAGAITNPGVWEGNDLDGWTWKGLGNPVVASLPLAQVTPVTQWPGSNNASTYATVFIGDDVSGGISSSLTPPNGCRAPWRSWKTLTSQKQLINARWDGSQLLWTDLDLSTSAELPSKLWAYLATTTAPGRYSLVTTTWTFEAHQVGGTWAGSTTPTITGTLPTGGAWLSIGMGLYQGAGVDVAEGLLGIYVTGTTVPWTTTKAVVFSAGASGALTVQQTYQLPNSQGVTSQGGGLVVQTYQSVIGSVTYPMTILTRIDGRSTPVANLIEGVEVIPSSIVPLALTGTAGSKVVSGWYALGLETYADSNFAPARRLRFLWLSPSLQVLNGDLVPSLATPDDNTLAKQIGDLVADPVTDGPQSCKMVRSGYGNRMLGVFGSRRFMIDSLVTNTLGRVNLANYDVLTFLQDACAACLASYVPLNSGGIALVSRGTGTLRTRTNLSGNRQSVMPDELENRKNRPVFQALSSEVRIGYTVPAASGSNTTAKATAAGIYSGGQPLEIDLSGVLADPTSANAAAVAAVDYFGNPLLTRTETWRDITTGATNSALAAPFWATWNVGDLVVDETVPAASNWVWKITKLAWRLEDRAVDVELLRLPFQQVIP